jgi:hypothetical protein
LTLAFQIVLALVVLVGLITTIMSVKNWHWAQMLLLLGIFFSSLGTLVLGMEVFRIHRNYRKAIPAKEIQLADVQAEIDALQRGTRDASLAARVFAPEEPPFDMEAEVLMPSGNVWSKRLQAMARQRGRVWRDVKPTGQFDPKTGRVIVGVAQPQPHGLAKDSIVFAFEQGEPNAAEPNKGPRYLGEFRVVETQPDAVQLEPVLKLDVPPGAVPQWFTQLQLASLQRLAQSQGPWSLYETMPADRHELFAGLTEDELKKMLPAASVEEYLRHGTPANEDDDEYHRAAYDEQDRRLGPDDADKAVKVLYDRQLRDYAYLFSELLRRRVVLTAEHSGLTEDISKLKAALANGQQLTAHREAEKGGLTGDLEHMKRDQQTIEALLEKITAQLQFVQTQTAELLRQNLSLAADFAERQLSLLEAIGSTQASTAP